MYTCCVFDLDGTLINTINAITRTVNLTLEKLGYPPVDTAHVKVFVGDGFRKLLERALRYSGDEKLEHLEEAVKLYQDFFKKNCLYQIEAYDGMPELLAFLKERGLKIAVLSNKAHERTVENIEKVYGKGYFDLVAGEKEGINRKPDPIGLFLILEELGEKPENVLYLGDTSTDMKTGIAAGVDTAGVTWGFRPREELEAFHPKYIVTHPSQIMKIIEG